MTAAFKGSIKCLNLLIERGSNLNHVDDLGRSALYLAASKDFGHCVSSLIEGGAIVDLTGGQFTPLGLILFYHDNVAVEDDIAKMLLLAGANLSKATKNIKTPPPWVREFDADLKRRVSQCRKALLALIRTCNGSKFPRFAGNSVGVLQSKCGA
jgi:hypothetical protein